MFGISGEHILILAIILIIFGPKRLPDLGNKLGKAIKNFKDGLAGVEEAQYRNLPDQNQQAQTPASAAPPTEKQSAGTGSSSGGSQA